MKLWQEIIFLKHFFKGKWVVENVKSYYTPLITPQSVGRHYVWSNFLIPYKKNDSVQIGTMNRQASKEAQNKAVIKTKQFGDLLNIKLKNKAQTVRNCVEPEIGKLILDYAINPVKTQGELF
jgi:DNA (cytosine-5)-methyltransferase 1